LSCAASSRCSRRFGHHPAGRASVGPAPRTFAANNPPNVPTTFSPTGIVSSAASISAIYSDPDSDSGSVHFTITDDDGNVTSGAGSTVSSGQASVWNFTSLASGHEYSVAAYSQDASLAVSSTVPSSFKVDVAPQWTLTPLVSPAANAVVPPQQPVLSASATDSDTALLYEFAVYSDSTCSTLVPNSDSDLLYDTSTYTVPTGLLTDGQDYWWRARADDVFGLTTGWSSECRKLTIRTPRFGVRDSWPTWQRGPIAVNLATGNLVLSLPGPSYDTGAGTIGLSLVYNSLDTRPPASGLPTTWPQGWTLVTGQDPPALVDHSQSNASNKFDAVELIWGDGDSDFYTHIGTSNAYRSPPDDLNVLSKNATGGFLLTGADGTLYVYDPPASSGMAALQRVETSSTANGLAHTEYGYDVNGKIASVSAWAKDSGGTDRQLAKLTFTWSCTGALLCVEGPDNAGTGSNVTWKYIGDGDGRIYQVNDGTRVVAQVEYPASGATQKPSSIKDANDLNPNSAGSGYSGSTGAPGYAHALQLTYTSTQLTRVVETDVRNRFYSPTRPDRTWDFSYRNAASCSGSLPAAHAHTPAFTRLALGGCTDVTTPVHFAASDGKKSTVYYDVNANGLASVDIAANSNLSAYDDQGRLRWTEETDDDTNVDGNPVDYTYNDFDGSLKSVTGPDPDGAGGLSAATTSYRYDETDIGASPTTPGSALHGLRAYYFDNQNFSGRPKLITNDPNVDSATNWGGVGTAPPNFGGQSTNFSVRWIGVLNIASTSNYVIRTVADGSTRVTIDGVQVINKPSGQTTSSTVCNKTPITLTGAGGPTNGAHRIVVEYSETTGQDFVQLKLGTTCANASVVASSDLRPGWLNLTSTVLSQNTVSGGARLTFSHYKDPWTGRPDYSRQSDGSNTLITAFVYDAFGRLSQSIAPKGNSGRTFSSGTLNGSPNLDYATTLDYYAPNETASWTGCSLSNSPTVGNQRALLKSTRYGDMTPRTLTYDVRGNPVISETAHGKTCRYFSDEDRLQEEKAPGEANITSFYYAPGGQLLETNDGTDITTAYNEAGEPIEGVDFYNAEIETSYDVNGNASQRRVDTSTDLSNALAGYATSYTYNDDDQLTALTDPTSKQWKFFYDHRGNLKATTYPNNTFSWNDVLPTGWTSQTLNRDCASGTCFTSLPSSPDADSTPLADFTYSYFENGQRKSETRNGINASAETTDYTYDPVGRLSTVTGPQPHTYCYDLNSNRTSIYPISSGVTCGLGSPTSTYSYSTTRLDQLTALSTNGRQQDYSYSSDGEVTARGGDSLTWDGRGRATGGTFDNLHGVQFTVDGSNLGTLDTVQPFERSLDTSTLSNGWHTFGATVTNEQGANTQAPTRVYTKNPNNGIGLIADLGSATSSGSANSVTLTVPVGAGTIPVGATVVIGAAQVGTTFSSAIDSAGNTYTIDKATTTNGTASIGTASARLTTALAPGATITARFGVTATASRGMSAAAFQGLQTTTGWRDQTANNSGTDTGPLVNSGTTTVGGELIIGAIGVNSNATFTPSPPFAGGGGFTKLTSATLSNLGVHLIYRVVTVKASYAAGGTLGSNQAWAAQAVTYKPSDGTAPTTPASLTPTTSAGRVSLTWTASTDANGISLYRVYRSTTSGFTPGTSTEVGQTTATSYTDDGDGIRPRLPSGTYYYKVIAEDTRGNASAASTQANATVTEDETRPMVDLDMGTIGSQKTPLTGTITLAAIASDPAPSGTISYSYDAARYRKSRTINGTTTRYLLGGLIETDTSGTITKFDVDGPSGDLAEYSAAPSGIPTYLYYSAHGDVVAQDASGTRTAFKYGPFGDLFTAETGPKTVERFTGRWDKKLDPTSGLIEMGVRPYDPSTGRFYATDPVVGGGCNTYDYVCQDPVNGYDLTGTLPEDYWLEKGGINNVPDIAEQTGRGHGGNKGGGRSGGVSGVASHITESWDEGTFKKAEDSALYHYDKWGKPAGVSLERYTADARKLYRQACGRGTPEELYGGRGTGIRIKIGKRVGVYTTDGRIVTFRYSNKR
jgi:RHS repeat-associated protein